jgi:hypothetical protein
VIGAFERDGSFRLSPSRSMDIELDDWTWFTALNSWRIRVAIKLHPRGRSAPTPRLVVRGAKAEGGAPSGLSNFQTVSAVMSSPV